MSLETSDDYVSFYADQELLCGKILTLKEKFKEIDKISINDIIKTAQDIFQPEKLNLALIGPFPPLKITKLWQKTIKNLNF